MVTSATLLVGMALQGADLPPTAEGPRIDCRMERAGSAFQLVIVPGEGRLVNSPNIIGEPHYSYQFGAARIEDSELGYSGPSGPAYLNASPRLRSAVARYPAGVDTAQQRQIVVGSWRTVAPGSPVDASLNEGLNPSPVAEGFCVVAPGTRWSANLPEEAR